MKCESFWFFFFFLKKKKKKSKIYSNIICHEMDFARPIYGPTKKKTILFTSIDQKWKSKGGTYVSLRCYI
jgi:hypothetical protein